MDIQMPGLDGYETTRRIRAAENGIARIPIVAMTAGALEGDRERAIEAGMDDYVTKPLRPEQIDAVLERWAGGPSPAELNEPVIDDGRIRRFVEDYPEIVERLVALFEESTPPLLDQLAEAAARGDEGAIRTLSHKLRSSVENVGASRMAVLCRALEEPGARHAPLVDELRAVYPATLEEIHAAVAAPNLS
jgi:HPt (histidine-containing phosphotransfer) domain-containing protein